MSSDNATDIESAATPPPPPPLPPAAPRRKRTLLIGALVALVVLLPLLAGGLWLGVNTARERLVTIQRANAGPYPWSNATRKTAPSAQYAVFAQQNNPVDPAFRSYYTRENGKELLGSALTPAYPTELGWTQIFANGALVAPMRASGSGTATPAPSALNASMLRTGKYDATTGVMRLPLLDALLTIGSEIPLGGADSALTYITIREATATSHFAHLKGVTAEQTATTGDGVFIAASASHGTAAGHTVPLSIWTYITSSAVAPNGWQDAFGDPLTEALPTTATINGATHHLLVQAFVLATAAVDLDADDAQGQPTGSVLPLGLDYLETLGPPIATVATDASAWLTGDAAIVSAPGGSTASVHLGLNFPLALSGKTQWLDGALWYEATWKSLKLGGSGWAPASAVTITAPAKDAAAWASFDALAPDLASYLASYGTNVGSVVYDITRGRYYAYNENTAFVLASSSKVSIMVSYLSWLESQGRGPSDSENLTLTNMIEHSDNNAAQLLFDRLGGGPGQAAFYQRIGVTGYIQNPYGWGWASLPPLGQMQVLTMLQQGKILTANDRAYALNLMHNVESDQRMGVGVTLPPGATVAMKDGWVPAPDGLWAINTSGIVTVGGETYIIVVYTAHQGDYDAAWNITQHVCKEVGQLLTQG